MLVVVVTFDGADALPGSDPAGTLGDITDWFKVESGDSFDDPDVDLVTVAVDILST